MSGIGVGEEEEKTWAMAAARLGYLVAPSWIVDELDKVVLPYHLDSMKQIAGLVALDFVDAMEERVSIQLLMPLLKMVSTKKPSSYCAKCNITPTKELCQTP